MGNATIDSIDRNLELIRAQLNMLAMRIQQPTQSGGSTATHNEYTPIGERAPYESESSDKLTGVLPFAGAGGQGALRGGMNGASPEEESSGGFTQEDLINATYTFREAAHSMRGYLMLLDQLGLSKDQKKLIRDLEYIMMMVSKIGITINFVMKAAELAEAPETMGASLLPLIFGGGTGSAAIAYGMKTLGGGN